MGILQFWSIMFDVSWRREVELNHTDIFIVVPPKRRGEGGW